MKALLDTSVLVPVFLGDHDHHQACLQVFVRYHNQQACCAAHSLAEVYSTVTRLPGKHRVGGEQAMLFLEDIRKRLAIVTLDGNEYFEAIGQASSAGIVGGTIYDVLVAHCALKAKVETLYTFNLKHFQLLGPEVGKRLKAPREGL